MYLGVSSKRCFRRLRKPGVQAVNEPQPTVPGSFRDKRLGKNANYNLREKILLRFLGRVVLQMNLEMWEVERQHLEPVPVAVGLK
jgi:hypothetical protein